MMLPPLLKVDPRMDAQNHETSTQKGKLDEPFSNGIHHLNRENMRGLTLFVGGCTYF